MHIIFFMLLFRSFNRLVDSLDRSWDEYMVGVEERLRDS